MNRFGPPSYAVNAARCLTSSRNDGRWVLVTLLSILLTIVTCKDEAPATSSEPWDPFGHLDLAVGDSSEIDAPVEDGVFSDAGTDEMRSDLHANGDQGIPSFFSGISY